MKSYPTLQILLNMLMDRKGIEITFYGGSLTLCRGSPQVETMADG